MLRAVHSLHVCAFLVSGTSNHEVQEKAYTYQALPNLLNLLSPSSPEMVQRRALYGLGALLRGNRLAVEEFVSKGGIEWISTDVTQHTESVVIKTLTLLTDLLEFEVSGIMI